MPRVLTNRLHRYCGNVLGMSSRVAVIGGGTLGVLIGLQLSNSGIEVEIHEAKSEILKGASYRGEGKVHLGFVYGKSSENTWEPLIQSALLFDKIIEKAIGCPIAWESMRSKPFVYKVEQKSMISNQQFIDHARKITSYIKRTGKKSSYLGVSIDELVDFFQISADKFQTQERSIDLVKLGGLLQEQVANRANISVILNSEIQSIENSGKNGYRLRTRDTIIDKHFDYVVNCTWHRGSVLDQLFWEDVPNLNYRTRLYVSAFTNLPEIAITSTLGRFGDLVVFQTGRIYASDYTAGLTSFTNSKFPVFEERDNLPIELCKSHWEQIKTRYAHEYPQLTDIDVVETFERSIVAEGTRDIDHIDSELHQRMPYHFKRKDNYFSALASKITTVPQLSKLVADLITNDAFI